MKGMGDDSNHTNAISMAHAFLYQTGEAETSFVAGRLVFNWAKERIW
jgi:hypothetical protein